MLSQHLASVNVSPATVAFNTPAIRARKVLSEHTQFALDRLYEEWNADPSNGWKVINSFNQTVLQQNMVLIDYDLIDPVFDACKNTKNIEFADQVWNYITDYKSRNTLKNTTPDQALYLKLLNIYQVSDGPFNLGDYLKCIQLIGPWINAYKTQRDQLINGGEQNNIFFNEIIRLILKLDCHINFKQQQISYIYNGMVDLGIIPNQETINLVRSANDDNSGRLILPKSQIMTMIQQYHEWNMDIKNCSLTLQSFQDNVLMQNVVLEDNVIIVPVLDACDMLKDVTFAKTVWKYLTSDDPKNCLLKPTHAMYLKIMQIYQSHVIGSQLANNVLAQWVAQYKNDTESLSIGEIDKCAILNEMIKIFALSQINREQAINTLLQVMIMLDIKPNAETGDILKNGGVQLVDMNVVKLIEMITSMDVLNAFLENLLFNCMPPEMFNGFYQENDRRILKHMRSLSNSKRK